MAEKIIINTKKVKNRRGFFSVLFLLAIAFLIIHSFLYFENFQSSYNENVENYRILTMERIYQFEMNLKETTVIGTKEGSKEGLATYLISLPEDEDFNVEDAKKVIKIFVNEKMSMINGASQINDFSYEIWCGNPRKIEIEELKKKIIEKKNIVNCKNCHKVDELLYCTKYINVNFNEDVENGENPSLSSASIGNNKGTFGISIYSEKFNVDSVFKIPKQEVDFLE